MRSNGKEWLISGETHYNRLRMIIKGIYNQQEHSFFQKICNKIWDRLLQDGMFVPERRELNEKEKIEQRKRKKVANSKR
jgi:hypothetical protein